MNTKDTGGPAFASGAVLKARARPSDPGSDFIVTAREEPFNPGMTLRDYFAAKAVQGLLAADTEWSMGPEMISRLAYDQADAMLEARSK
jgi:hypothetical protein